MYQPVSHSRDGEYPEWCSSGEMALGMILICSSGVEG